MSFDKFPLSPISLLYIEKYTTVIYQTTSYSGEVLIIWFYSDRKWKCQASFLLAVQRRM